MNLYAPPKPKLYTTNNYKNIRGYKVAKKITVYTSNNCSYCVMVKRYLDMKGESYSEINIEANPDRQKELIELSGQQRVPVTIIENDNGARDISVGYNLSSLASAIA